MTNGIEVNDIVIVKRSRVLAEVIGIEDSEDRYPADVILRTNGGIIKARVDEISKLPGLKSRSLGAFADSL